MSGPVTAYLASLQQPRRGRIERLYAQARALVPDAIEGTKYAMPALVVGGKGLIAVMSTKHHIGIYPFSGSVVGEYADRLAALGIPTTKGAIQLPDGVELPDDTFAEIVRSRLAQIG